MANRHVFHENQTKRLVPLPTVREVLELPVMVGGLPVVLAGDNRLDQPVRWVHVSDSPQAGSLLDGGELLLSTGGGWDLRGQAPTEYIETLIAAGAVGLILETVRHHLEVPPAIVRACRKHDFPLIELRREVKFVSVTEAVHSRILSEQTNALRARAELHELFTGLSLRGSPAHYIVSQLGELLECPVILEDLNHHVVALGGPGASGESALAGWETRSRQAHRAATGGATDPDDWLIVPVEARGTRWGCLVALPGDEHPASRRTVLEQGAVALALSRLADKTDDEWVRRNQQEMLSSLIGGQYSSENAVRERFEASGMPVTGRTLVGLAIGVEPTGESIRLAIRAADASGAVAIAGGHPDGHGGHLLLALSIAPAVSAVGVQELLSKTFAASVGLSQLEVAVGAEAEGVAGVLASLDEASELLRSRAGGKTRGITIYRSENRPLLRLITALGGDPRLHSHAEQLLKPLVEYDLDNGGDLLFVLRSYVRHPGNRTHAAAESHLSRSVFYQRIDLIEGLLGMNLGDGETVSALHAALLARG